MDSFLPRPMFASLDELVASSACQSLSGIDVCFVTSELAELHQNGGIGTATSGLIQALNIAGARITVFYTGHAVDVETYSDVSEYPEIRALRGSGIEIIFLQREYPPSFRESRRKISYACFDFLKKRKFHVIHFNDYGGNGYYTCLAKRTQSHFLSTTIVITVHGPTLWASAADQEPLSSAAQYEHVFLEHESISHCDVCIGVSFHLLQWLRENNVSLPNKTFLHKNCQPNIAPRPHERLDPISIDRIVFFGRMDQRKGVDVFVEAIELFASRHPKITISFVGKYSSITGEHSAGYIVRRLGHLRNKIELISGLDRDGALAEISTRGTLVVIPSHDENSPCVIVECQMAGIPFIASDVGGIRELISPADIDATLFACNVSSLVERLEAVWLRGHSAIYPNCANEEIASIWVKFHNSLIEKISSDEAVSDSEERPLVSVCVTHYKRSHLLVPLLDAIEQQCYPNMEVIVVDDGSDDLETSNVLAGLVGREISGRPIKIVQIKNSYLGAARNTAARNAAGKYLKFQDDDNLPSCEEISSLVRAAEATNSAIVTCFAYQFMDERPNDPSVLDVHYFPLGDAEVLGYLRNEFGDANALISREVFEIIGGFTEDRDIGCEDYELFAKATTSGFKLVCVPEPLFYYRVSPQSMLQTGGMLANAKRARRGYSERSASFFKTLADLEWGRQILQERNKLAWYKASKYPHAAIHQQLLDGEPNGSKNHRVIAELLAATGHIEDAISYSLRNSIFAESLQWINTRIPEAILMRNRENGARGFPVFLDLRNDIGARVIAPMRQELPNSWHPDWGLVTLMEKGLLIHPVGDLVTVASLPSALGQGAVGAIVRWSHTNAAGGPVEVSVGIPTSHGNNWSPWYQVSPRGGAIEVALNFDRLVKSSNLLLRTKAVGSDENAWIVAETLLILF